MLEQELIKAEEEIETLRTEIYYFMQIIKGEKTPAEVFSELEEKGLVKEKLTLQGYIQTIKENKDYLCNLLNN
jgi:hypothetical protein